MCVCVCVLVNSTVTQSNLSLKTVSYICLSFALALLNFKNSLLCFHNKKIFQKKHDKLFPSFLMTHTVSCFVISYPLAKASRESGVSNLGKLKIEENGENPHI